MIINKTYKFRIYPNKLQKEIINKTLDLYIIIT